MRFAYTPRPPEQKIEAGYNCTITNTYETENGHQYDVAQGRKEIKHISEPYDTVLVPGKQHLVKGFGVAPNPHSRGHKPENGSVISKLGSMKKVPKRGHNYANSGGYNTGKKRHMC
jgi:hypothetical protein